MYFEHISNSNELQDRTLNSLVVSETQALETESKTITPKPHEISSSLGEFFLWATVLSIISLVLIKVSHKLETVKIRGSSILPVARIPCKSCKFYARNQYLNCAVRPLTVLTAQAVNCSDYCSKQGSYLQTNS